jgi:hypothetical protein
MPLAVLSGNFRGQERMKALTKAWLIAAIVALCLASFDFKLMLR